MSSESAKGDVAVAEVLQSLPIAEDGLYLRMQATNLGMVDLYLRDLEGELLSTYMEDERTPGPQTVFVSALSQLWVLGLYELLRTWRQRVQAVLDFIEEMASRSDSDLDAALERKRKSLTNKSSAPDIGQGFVFAPYSKAAEDNSYVERLAMALYASELLFRRIEALRMSLAKHEIPRQPGSRALAPGYGRIDLLSGSIQWQVSLGADEVDLVSRRNIADNLAMLLDDITAYILPEEIQEEVKRFRRYGYGVKLTTVILADGREFPGTLVAWNQQVVAVLGREDIPFDAREVRGIKPDTTPRVDPQGEV